MGLPQNTVKQLQLIQNTTARVLLLVYKSHNGVGTMYLSNVLQQYELNRALRSLEVSQLHKA